MTSISRRALLTSIPAIGVCSAAYGRLIEPAWLEVTRRTCALPHLRRPVTIAHLSDLHASRVVPPSVIENAIAACLGLNPDLFCLTGDFVTNATGFDARWYRSVLSRLAAEAPAYAVLGNHDGGLWAASAGGFATTQTITTLLEQSGISVLNNRCERLSVRGQLLQIAGVGDMWAGEIRPDEAFAATDPGIPSIVLSHNPDSKAMLYGHPWHLMLSGHTHGGQVVVPGLGLSPAPVWDRGYVAGLKPWRDRWIHISRGVGNVAGIRFNCRPEVTELTLTP